MQYNLYRISDAGRIKDRVQGSTPINCLKNFLEVFGAEGLYVFADNCSAETVTQIKALGIRPVLLNLGNSGSLRHIIDFAIANFKAEDYVYLVEDDYWHLPEAKQALTEGLQIADYVTLYDFPDKYAGIEGGGLNPYVTNGAETGRVYLSQTCHWKTSNSTTMTFAARVATLKEDRHVFWEFTQQNIPNDFGIFLILTKQSPWPLFRKPPYHALFYRLLYYYFIIKKRELITALPGLSAHLETAQLSPHTDWELLIKNFSQKSLLV